MSKNQKSINIFKEFFQENMGANTYNIKEYSLEGNYPLFMMIEVKTGGSAGGDCWGGYTSQYSQDMSEITDFIAEKVQYNLSGLAHSFNLDKKEIENLSLIEADKIQWSDVGSKSDSGDYYGNYTEYKMFAVDVLAILKQVMTPKDYEILEGLASTVKLIKDREYKSADLLKQEQELVNKIGAFPDVKSEERDNTEKALQEAKKRVADLTEHLKTFDSKKSKQKSRLTEQLETIRKHRIEHDGPDVVQCTVQKEIKKNRYN